MPAESISQNNPEFTEKVNKLSQDTISYLTEEGFKVEPTDASFLRQILIPNLLAKNPNMNFLSSLTEIFENFFLLMYGVNVSEYFKTSKSVEEDKKRKKDLYEYVQTKLRRE
ncbi:MAG: hypothetical protein WAN61_01025 [Minisyncoccia bacterium]